MTYSKEITDREWYGVKIPRWLRVFDCRGDGTVKAWRTLWASEAAEVDLGLRTETESHATTPVSGSGYADMREYEPDAKLAVARMVQEAKKLRLAYTEALGKPPTEGDGGSCHYPPVAVALCNFGWSVIADRRVCVVRRFGP